MLDPKQFQITLGDYDWYVLKNIGSKTLILSESVLFRGYYALNPCSFSESKAGKFLQTVFASRLKTSGVDVSKISNISVLTLTQYEAYVKNVFPLSSVPFILANNNPDNNEEICQVSKEGKTEYIGIREQTGFRPCLYIDTEYLKQYTGIECIVDAASSKPEETVSAQTKAVSEENLSEQIDTVDVSTSEKEEKVEQESIIREQKAANVNSKTHDDNVSDNIIAEAEVDTFNQAQNSTDFDNVQIEDSLLPNAEIQKEEDQTYSIYMYRGEFEKVATIFDGQNEKIKKAIERQGVSISDFIQSSQNKNRVPLNEEDIVSKIKKNQGRWSWSAQKGI